MNDQQFEMMMQMHRDTHDKIDSVVQAVVEVKEVVASQVDAFNTHVKDDLAVHKVVDRHTVYFRFLSGGVTTVAGWLGLTK